MRNKCNCLTLSTHRHTYKKNCCTEKYEPHKRLLERRLAFMRFLFVENIEKLFIPKYPNMTVNREYEVRKTSVFVTKFARYTYEIVRLSDI